MPDFGTTFWAYFPTDLAKRSLREDNRSRADVVSVRKRVQPPGNASPLDEEGSNDAVS